MRQDISQQSFKLRANIRPIKIAYFVKLDDSVELLNVLRLISTQWGGLFHLIVPLEMTELVPPLYEDLLLVHEPDWFVSYWDFSDTSNAELSSKLVTYLRSLFPNRNINVQPGQIFEKNDITAHALHVVNNNLLRENRLLHSKVALGANEVLGSALFGQIYPGQETYYKQSTTIVEEEVEIGSEAFWRNQFEINPFSSVINLTTFGIRPYKVVGGELYPTFDHFDIVVVNSSSDVCLYWNIRAVREVAFFKQETGAGRRTLCLPLKLLNDHSALMRLLELIKEKLFFPGRRANLDLRFYCPSNEIFGTAKSVFEELQMLEAFNEPTIKGNPFHLGGEENEERNQVVVDRPLTYIFSRLNVPQSYFEGILGSIPNLVNLHYGTNQLRIDPPPGYHNRHAGAVALDIECDVWKRFPNCPLVAESIEKNSWFSRYGITLAVHLPHTPHFRVVTLPSERESVRLYFENKGYKTRFSKVEQYSNAVIDLVGSINKVAPLATKQSYSLLALLAQKSSKKIAQRIVEHLQCQDIHAEDILEALQDVDVQPELKNLPKTFGELRDDPRVGLGPQPLLELLDQLVMAQILKRGFYTACPNCGVADWYPLESINEYLTCPGCSYRFTLPVREPSKPNTEMQLRYRLNSLVNRAVDQDVLVGILALHHLSRDKETFCHTFGLEVLQNDAVITDLDFLFVSEQRLYAGECKTGNRLANKDLDTAKLAADLGFAGFYFCTVKEFDNETLDCIENLRLQLSNSHSKTKISVLSGRELLGDGQNQAGVADR